MRVFDYRCPECETMIEDLSSDAKIQCDCKGKDSPYFQRVYSVGGISFKGKGFFRTDDKGKGSSPGA